MLKHPAPAALLWATVLLVCTVLLGLRLSGANPGQYFDSNIMALLPNDEQAPMAELATRTMADHFADDILLLVGAPKHSDSDLRALTESLTAKLNASGEFRQVSSHAQTELQQQLSVFYLPYRYQLLSPAMRQQLQATTNESLQLATLRQLYSPVAPPRGAPLLADPFNLLGDWLLQWQPQQGFRADAWGLTASDEHYNYRVIQASFNGNAYEPRRQQQLLAVIDQAARDLDLPVAGETSNELRLLRSGLLFHAAAGAKQAEHEMSTIGLGSLLGIMLLLLWYFRALLPLLLPVISIGAGLLLALTACLYLFGSVHIITLAFGASLVGVSVDYALHFLCAQRQLGRSTLRHILPGISLGLFTSVLAYSAQALTPFPGLQQIAVFSAIGLIGAWLTVVCWFPWLYWGRSDNKNDNSNSNSNSNNSNTALWRGLQQLARWRRPLMGLLAFAVLLALAGLTRLHFVDDLNNLQSSPTYLLEGEKTIQKLSERPGASRFLLVQADGDEALLQREEALREQLDALVSRGELQSYQALSQFIPSVAQQQQDYQLVRTQLLEQQRLAQLFTALGVASEAQLQSQELLEQHQPRWLTLADWQQLPVSQLLPYLWLGNTAPDNVTDVNAAEAIHKSTSVISLGTVADASVYDQLKAIAQAHHGVQFVDRIEGISQLLARYRITVSEWMLLAAAAILVLLSWRYGRYGWLILAPPLLATLMTFGLLALGGNPLNLFNLLAALLVLGIGLDIGIFLRESDQQPHAWDAVSLSALTSILAFGLLALSDTVILHHFGATVLPGLVLTWLLSFVLAAGRIAPTNLTNSFNSTEPPNSTDPVNSTVPVKDHQSITK